MNSHSATPAVTRADPNRWLAFAVVLSATLLGVLDFLIVNLALPAIKETTGASDAQVQLTVAVYGLSFAVCLITGGRLGDLYGRKRIFQIGMAGFTLASVLCGFARSGEDLIIFRIVQGAFAALMSPQVLATIQVMFVGHERNLATSYVGATVGVGSFLGNVLGGYLVSANLFGLGWRPIFFVNVPIGIVALVLSAFLLRESKSEHARKLDVPGALLSGLALFLLIFPISEGRERGFPWWSWVMVGCSLVVGYAWFRFEAMLERKGGSPLVPLELFDSKGYGRGLVAILLLFSGISSTSFVVGQFLQRGLGLEPRYAGIVFAALSLSFLISSLGSARIVAYMGTKALLLGISLLQVGQVLIIAATLGFRGQLNPYLLMPILFIYGLGQGLCVPQIIRQTMNTVGTENAGAASGVLSTTQQVAFSLGVSVIGGVFFALSDPKGAGTADSWALGTGAAFGINFVIVLLARFLVARNMKEAMNLPTQNYSAVAVEA
ncbi:multidrug resistance protein Stp [Abditibacteriota bacterium]|nr:multidrug resistance protein Stp [Abditibacteriota bacterium]